MTVLNTIRAALETHLATLSGVPPIARPNSKFDPSLEQQFLRVYFAPVSRRPANMGPSPLQRYEGLYTINVCSQNGVGEGPNLLLVDALLAKFDATVDIVYEDIKVGINYSEAGLGYPDSPFFCTPVVVSWYTYN